VTALERFRRAGVLGPLDVHFARTLAKLADRDDDDVRLGAALAACAPLHGHVCADLDDLPRLVRPETDEVLADLAWPAPSALRAALLGSGLVREAGDETITPLVLDGPRLYLDRYWRDERAILEAIRARLPAAPPGDAARMRSILERLFRREGEPAPVEQMRAAATAALRPFTVITGGPGTGKTTTVVRVLALLHELAGGEPPRALLLAPTGKAAARLSESIRGQLARLDSPARAALPTEASTIHRALRPLPGSPGRFRHDADNPLPADVVVVDEASMVDVALMARLFEALAPGARLVLLGDCDQLASVDAGAVLGDICNAGAPRRGPSRAFAEALTAATGAPVSGGDDATGIWDAVAELTTSHRFDANAGIGRLARAVIEGRADDALAALRASGGQLDLVELEPGAPTPAALKRHIVDGFRPALTAADPERALGALGALRVLAAHRRGPRGVERLNPDIEAWLAAADLVDPRERWYRGRPVIVTENDYAVSLFNGDVGLVLDHASGRPRAFFAGVDGPRALPPGRLPPHETNYAMSVHKSQGSEFDQVVLVLPDRRSPILTRELLYTGITRARKHVTVVGRADVVRAAVQERVQRTSGLRGALWGAAAP
jgi:exodeoxyribonuclease V alpha subunit